MTRRAKKTKLTYSEGLHDFTFLKLLDEYYTDKNSLSVTIKAATGGSQDTIVRRCVNYEGGYDERFVVMDNDRDREEMTKADDLAQEHNIRILRNTPCIDRVLIAILEPQKQMRDWTSRQCKKYLEENLIPHSKRGFIVEYRRKFPKDLLDSARRNCSDLDNMIKIFES